MLAPSLNSHLGNEVTTTSEVQMGRQSPLKSEKAILSHVYYVSQLFRNTKTTKINEELRAISGLLHFILTKYL